MFDIFICLFIPIVIVITGHTLKTSNIKRNGAIGHRSALASKNDYTWKYANELLGDIWYKSGILILIVSGLVLALAYAKNNSILPSNMLILVALQIAFIIASWFYIEKRLKEKFDENGYERK